MNDLYVVTQLILATPIGRYKKRASSDERYLEPGETFTDLGDSGLKAGMSDENTRICLLTSDLRLFEADIAWGIKNGKWKKLANGLLG